jgi:hypothetical protein
MGHPVLFSVSDVLRVLASIGCPLTGRQLRYLGVASARRGPGNSSRLYDAVDVGVFAVFAALAQHCRALGLPLWSARAAMRYREAEIRRALQVRRPRFVIVDPLRGSVSLSETADQPKTAIDLRGIAARVSTAVETYRAEHTEVWTGVQYEDVDDVRAWA